MHLRRPGFFEGPRTLAQSLPRSEDIIHHQYPAVANCPGIGHRERAPYVFEPILAVQAGLRLSPNASDKRVERDPHIQSASKLLREQSRLVEPSFLQPLEVKWDGHDQVQGFKVPPGTGGFAEFDESRNPVQPPSEFVLVYSVTNNPGVKNGRPCGVEVECRFHAFAAQMVG